VKELNSKWHSNRRAVIGYQRELAVEQFKRIGRAIRKDDIDSANAAFVGFLNMVDSMCGDEDMNFYIHQAKKQLRTKCAPEPL
jgi:hypothetical protein